MPRTKIISKTRKQNKAMGLETSSKTDVNRQNADGFSPLMLAASNGLVDVVSELLDAGADVNAVSKIDDTRTALSCAANKRFLGIDSINCMIKLLDRGARSSYVTPFTFFQCIINGDMEVVVKLMESGLGPVDIRPCRMDRGVKEKECIVSPLCMALINEHAPLARYFIGKCFLTKSDLSHTLHNKVIRNYLRYEDYTDCLEILDELSSQPMSLFTLAFVAVTSALGSLPGREKRVSLLPVPQLMKDKLLFVSQDVTLELPEGYYWVRDEDSLEFTLQDFMLSTLIANDEFLRDISKLSDTEESDG